MQVVLRSPITNRLAAFLCLAGAVVLIAYALKRSDKEFAIFALYALALGIFALVAEYKVRLDPAGQFIEIERGIYPFSWTRTYGTNTFYAVQCRRQYRYRAAASFSLILIGQGASVRLGSYSFAYSALNHAHDLAAALRLPIDDETAGGFLDHLIGL